MPLYECVLIARNDVTQQQVEAVADGIGTGLEAEGGSVKKREYWGLRSLAYLRSLASLWRMGGQAIDGSLTAPNQYSFNRRTVATSTSKSLGFTT